MTRKESALAHVAAFPLRRLQQADLLDGVA